MKRTILVVSLLCFAGMSFGQKKMIKEAQSEMKKDLKSAREYINKALVNEETINDPEAWKVAGDIEHKQFSDEFDKEKKQAIFGGDGADMKLFNDGLFKMYDPYIKADSLGQIPDAKGKVKNKVRKDIVSNFTEGHPYYVNVGLEFYNNREYENAIKAFHMYWDLPQHEMFEGNTKKYFPLINDSTLQAVKYYTALGAYSNKDYPQLIKIVERIHAEGHKPTDAYEEPDTYRLLATAYQQMGDSVKFLDLLKEGADKYPENVYFLPSLVDYYQSQGQSDKALELLDLGLQNGQDPCIFMSAKGSFYVDLEEIEKATQVFEELLVKVPDCQRGLDAIGHMYLLEGTRIRQEAALKSRKEQVELDAVAVANFEKSLPYVLELKKIQEEAGMTKKEMQPTYSKLYNLYINLGMDAEFEEVKTIIEEILAQ